MLAYTTFDDIRGINRNLNESAVIAKAANKEYKTVFLSHSSKDAELFGAILKAREKTNGWSIITEIIQQIHWVNG